MPDDITVKNEFTLVPEGEYQAVCVDIVDLGMVHSEKWNKWQHKAAIVFQIDERDPKNAKRFEIAARHTLNMSPKANLRQFLGQWRGKPFSDAEANVSLSLASLVGANAMLTIVHNVSGEKTFANIFSLRKLAKGDAPMAPENYVRAEYWAKARAEQEAKAATADTPATQAARDPGRQSVKPRPPIFQGAAKAAGPGITDHDVPPAEYNGMPEDEDDDLPF
jgi:hypothetical protein